jgi:hypothetical protein
LNPLKGLVVSGWKWEELTGLPDLQLAVYHEPARASDGQSGQFDWHR